MRHQSRNNRQSLHCELGDNNSHIPMNLSKERLNSQFLQTKGTEKHIVDHELCGIEPTQKVENLKKKIVALLKVDLGTYRHVDAVATELSMSARTLRRQLRKNNVSFRNLLEEVRKEIAINMLQEKKCNLTEIALTLHYCDSSAFSNAFRIWTGMSPRKYRDSTGINRFER